MRIACDAGSLPHFTDHLLPIWQALPDEYKDGFYARGRAAARAKELGIPVDGLGQARNKELVLVASYEDHRRAGQAKTILLNHGVGQTYRGSSDAADHPSYSGGRDRERVLLYLCPSEKDAEICAASGSRVVAVGSVRLDWWHGLMRGGWMPQSGNAKEVVLKALCTLAAIRRPEYLSLKSGPNDRRTLLGADLEGRADRLLELAGIQDSEWIWAIQNLRENGTRPSSGLVPALQEMAEVRDDSRSHLSQRGPDMQGGSLVPPSGLYGGDSPAGSVSFRELESGRAQSESSENPLFLRALLRRPEECVRLLIGTTGGTEEMSSLSPTSGSRTEGSAKKPVVAISFHSDVHVCPETRSAFSHYQQAIIDLARDPSRPFDLLGHGHPRWGEFMAKFWKRIGVPFARHFDEVLEKADAYCIDNSSTGPEAASCGIPIVWMSASWYRRHVTHHGRFWNWTYGIPHATEPHELLPNILRALEDPPSDRYCREEMVRSVYGDLCDGEATGRAVRAIVDLTHG